MYAIADARSAFCASSKGVGCHSRGEVVKRFPRRRITVLVEMPSPPRAPLPWRSKRGEPPVGRGAASPQRGSSPRREAPDRGERSSPADWGRQAAGRQVKA